MPATSLDFYLRTCPGLHESMWQTTSSVIDWIINICYMTIPILLTLRFMTDESANQYNGVIEFKLHRQTIFSTILILFFLSNYKAILEVVDDFINIFHFSGPEFLKIIGNNVAKKGNSRPSLPPIGNLFNKGNGILNYISSWFVVGLSVGLHAVQKFCIHLIHFIKVYLVLITALIGPIAATGTLLPSIMRTNFSGWARSYLGYSCWGIVLNILKAFVEVHQKALETSSGFRESGASTITSVILIICIFMTPTITSQFLGGSIMPNLQSLSPYASSAANKGAALTNKTAGGLWKILKAVNPIKFKKG